MGKNIPALDGTIISEAQIQDLTCPDCGEKLNLKADKLHEGIDHNDCTVTGTGRRMGIAAVNPQPTTQTFRVVSNVLETPLRTPKEDKEVKKEAAKEAKQEEKQQAKEEAKEQKSSRK